MANIKTTQEEWARVREYFEAGLSLSKIVGKTGISKTQISKRSNSEGWAKGTEKEQLIADAVRVEGAKGTLTEQALDVHNEIVSETVSRLEILNGYGMTNVAEAMKLRCTTQLDHVQRSNTILKTKETLVGKTPDTAFQINNIQSPALSLPEYKQALREVLDAV